ncbi:TonB-dependent receptor [Phenylobacterium sp.]|uniref:TonB-dependent receptor n=1 Tax=Phenylobacterium sp. TaxID=1871053 RepID=UPI0025FA3994|nr:TonB-dependent receptor [Phenylobacterium sp.]
MTVRRDLLLAAASALSLGGAAAAAEAPAETPASTVEGVVVTAPRLEATARVVQKDAPNLVNVQSAETIAKYPDVNAAEALSRMPGVSLSIDTGEGRYVNIRGLDGNLNGATFGGVVLLNTLPTLTYFNFTGRAVEFDTVPIGAVDRLEIYKTGLPDHEAEGLGGQVELTPRTAINAKRLFAEVTLGGGYEPLRKTKAFRDEIVVGGRLGWGASLPGVTESEPLSFVLTQYQNNDRRGIDDVEAAYIDGQPDIPDKVFDALELRRYQYHRRRFGYSGELDFKASDDHAWFARATVAGYRESVNRQILAYNSLGDDAAVTPGAPNSLTASGANTAATLRDEQETHRNSIFAVGGKDRFGRLLIDYQAAYSRATYARERDINSTFRGPDPLTVVYDNTTNPDVPKVVSASGGNVLDPKAYALTGINNANEKDRDEEWSYAANASLAGQWLSDADTLKVGGKVRLRSKQVQPHNFSFAYTGPAKLLSDFPGGGPFVFYDDNYAVGVRASGVDLRRFLDNNPALFTRKLARDQGRDAGAFLDDDEDVYAGYGQYQGAWGPWSLLAGVRVEATDATYRGLSQVKDAAGAVSYRPNSRSHSYTNAFPTAQLRYQPSDDLVVRATFATAIARPGFLQTTQSSRVDVGANTVSTGNPNLKPTYGKDFDLSVEYYLPHSGIVSLGLFDKEFDDFIVARVVRGPYPDLVGIVSQTSFDNVSNARARGVEAAYVQRFDFLPAPFEGLGIDTNATYVDTRVELRPGETVALPGASKWTANASVFYEARGLQLRLAYQYVGKTLFGIGGSRATDVFQDKRATLDFTSSYQVTPAYNVYFNVKNLTDEPLRFYEASASRPIQREFYDLTYEAGVRAKF